MRHIITAIILIFALTSYAQIEPNIEFKFFRIATLEPKQSLAMDFNGQIMITKEWLVIKSKSYAVLDKRFNFISEANVKGAKAWHAYPQGEPYVKVYIEYSEGEYIIVFYVKSNVVTYFISEDVKYQYAPFKEYGVWYKKLN